MGNGVPSPISKDYLKVNAFMGSNFLCMLMNRFQNEWIFFFPLSHFTIAVALSARQTKTDICAV